MKKKETYKQRIEKQEQKGKKVKGWDKSIEVIDCKEQ